MRVLWMRVLCVMLLAGVAGLVGLLPAVAQRRLPPPSKEAAMLSFAPVAKKAAPAVVNVYVRGRLPATRTQRAEDEFFRRFFGERFGMPQERVQNSLGSGVIVHPDGLVVTNTHVVKVGGNAEIKVVRRYAG